MLKTSMVRVVGAVVLGLVAATVHAADLTANAGVASNYVFRGFTQSDDGPAIQGGIDFAPNNGFYAGAWGSTVDCAIGSSCFGGNSNGDGLEVDLYVGYHAKLKDNWGMDLGYIIYEYTDSNLDANRELYVGVNYQGFSFTYYRGNDTSANGPDYNYLDFKVKAELADKAYFLGHFGHFDPRSGSNWNDASIGVGKELWGLDFSLTLTSEDLTDKEKFYVTVVKRFDLK